MRNQITRLRYMVLWVKIGVLTPWTFHPFSNLVCYLVALKGSVVYPLSPNFFGCLVLSNFSCHVLLSVRKLAGEVTSSQDASWLWIQNYCNPRFFFFLASSSWFPFFFMAIKLWNISKPPWWIGFLLVKPLKTEWGIPTVAYHPWQLKLGNTHVLKKNGWNLYFSY